MKYYLIWCRKHVDNIISLKYKKYKTELIQNNLIFNTSQMGLGIESNKEQTANRNFPNCAEHFAMHYSRIRVAQLEQHG